MRLINYLEDNEFPSTYIDHTRNIVRGIIYDDNYNVAFCVLHIFDIFGERDLIETPGGGVDKGETLLEAFKREIFEEVGAKIDRIEEIGRVVDYYNLIHRKNNNHYYLAHIAKLENRHYTDYENSVHMDLIFIPIEEAIERYKKFRNLPVNNIVKNRELPILEIAKRRLNRLKNNI